MGKQSTRKPTKKIKEDHPIADEVKEGTPPVAKPFRAQPLVMVEPPKESEAVCRSQVDPYTICNHRKAMHYGGQKGHCNTSGCLCQEFK